MKLKARNSKERDEWCRALITEINRGNGTAESAFLFSYIEGNTGLQEDGDKGNFSKLIKSTDSLL
jgi:hypothetical protein